MQYIDLRSVDAVVGSSTSAVKKSGEAHPGPHAEAANLALDTYQHQYPPPGIVVFQQGARQRFLQ